MEEKLKGINKERKKERKKGKKKRKRKKERKGEKMRESTSFFLFFTGVSTIGISWSKS